MNASDFQKRMERVAAAAQDGRYEESLTAVRELRRLLLAEAGGDPAQLGWVRYYELRALFHLQRWEEGYRLAKASERKPWSVNRTNAAWMFSVSGEMAARVGQAEDTRQFGLACLSARRQDADPVPVVQCGMTFCTLLKQIGRVDLNGEFAAALVEIGVEHGAAKAVAAGVEAMLDNLDVTRDPALLVRVREEAARIRAWPVAADHRYFAAVEPRLVSRVGTDDGVSPAELSSRGGNDKGSRRAAGAGVDAAMTAFCEAGEAADAVLASGDGRKAVAAYSALLRDMQATGRVDVFIAAKATLGTLCALIGDGALSPAVSVWTADLKESTYGLGIYGLENGQTSVRDLIVYYLASAWLHAHSTNEPRASRAAVDDLLTRATGAAAEHAPELVKAARGAWVACYAAIGGSSVPPAWTADLERQADGAWRKGAALPTFALPAPARWVVDWGDGSTTEFHPDGSVKRKPEAS
jgi:hypothetical protein